MIFPKKKIKGIKPKTVKTVYKVQKKVKKKWWYKSNTLVLKEMALGCMTTYILYDHIVFCIKYVFKCLFP